MGDKDEGAFICGVSTNMSAPPGALGCSAFSLETTNQGEVPETGAVYRENLIGTKIGRAPGKGNTGGHISFPISLI